MWIITPWNDRKDYIKLCHEIAESKSAFGAVLPMLFYPARWAVRGIIMASIIVIVLVLVI